MTQALDPGDGFAELAILGRSFQITKMLEVAASLGLADRIDEQQRLADDLAAECGADPAMLLRLCRALAAFDVFTIDAGGNIGHTDRSRWLRKDSQPTLHYAVRYLGMPSIWAAWGNLEYTIRSGKPAFEAVCGSPYFDFLSGHPAEADIFDSYMQNSPDDRHAAVVDAYDFSGAGVVIDVGGGNGALLKAILSANLDVRGVLIDQEAVVAKAAAMLGGLAERCDVQAVDIFEAVPEGGDVYTLSQILHDWNDDRCLEILANCRTAMGKDARLLIIERLLDEDPARSDPMAFLLDMHMMVLLPGARERTPSEYSRLLRKAGFELSRVIPTRCPFYILESLHID